MITRFSARACLAVPVLLAAGCATTVVNVEKVPDPASGGPGPVGIRYSLPRPFLLVSPDPAGTGAFKVDVIYLPDECNTYAIDARTERGAYEFAVTVKDGLLSKVVWSQRGAELAAENLRTGGEIVRAGLDRVAEQQEAEEAKAEAARKAADAKIRGLEETLAERQLAVTLRGVEAAAAQDAVDAGDRSREALTALRRAQLELEKARAARDFTERQLEESRHRAAGVSSALGAPPAPAATNNEGSFWSPVLYAIDDTGSAVRLRAVDWKGNPPRSEGGAPPLLIPCDAAGPTKPASRPQVPFTTAKPPRPPALEEPMPAVVGSTSLVRIWRQGALRLTITLDRPVTALVERDRRLWAVTPRGTEPIAPPPFQVLLAKDRQSVTIEFPGPPLPEGEYRVELPFTNGANDRGSATLQLLIQH
jgi:hypothetical protein